MGRQKFQHDGLRVFCRPSITQHNQGKPHNEKNYLGLNIFNTDAPPCTRGLYRQRKNIHFVQRGLLQIWFVLRCMRNRNMEIHQRHRNQLQQLWWQRFCICHNIINCNQGTNQLLYSIQFIMDLFRHQGQRFRTLHIKLLL